MIITWNDNVLDLDFTLPLIIIAVIGVIFFVRSVLPRVKALTQQEEAARERIRSEYGITVDPEHIEDAMDEPFQGVEMRAVMANGVVRDILLRGEELRPYFKCGDEWLPVPTLTERAGA